MVCLGLFRVCFVCLGYVWVCLGYVSHANAWELHPPAELTELNRLTDTKCNFGAFKGASAGNFMGSGEFGEIKAASAGNFMGQPASL